MLPLIICICGLFAAYRALAIARSPEEIDRPLRLSFNVDGGSQRLFEYAEKVRASELFELSLTVTVSGCRSRFAAVNGEVRFDPLWMQALNATVTHHPLIEPVEVASLHERNVAIPRPEIYGTFGLLVSGQLEHPSVWLAESLSSPLHKEVLTTHRRIVQHDETNGPDTIISGAIPIDAAKRRSFDMLGFTFVAPWVHPRGFETCYVTTPSFRSELPATEPLEEQRFLADGPSTPEKALTSVIVKQGALNVTEASPPPNYSLSGHRWSCSRIEQEDSSTAPDCHTVAVVAESDEAPRLQLLIIIFSGIVAGSLVAAAAGLRRQVLRSG